MQACCMGWLQLLDVEAVPFLVAVLRSPSLWPGALPTFSEKPGAESLAWCPRVWGSALPLHVLLWVGAPAILQVHLMVWEAQWSLAEGSVSIQGILFLFPGGIDLFQELSLKVSFK